MKFREKIRPGGKKGITIVWLALFLLPLLLMFAAMAMDIAYMYNVKNQLQVAATAASLAGAGVTGFGGVDDATANPNILLQTAARSAAWQFACKNTAADNPKNVFLVSAPGDASSPACDGSDTPGNLNNINNRNGDIVVGNWVQDNTGIPCTPGWEPAGSGFFCPATGSTGRSINAVKAVARRTFANPVTDVSIGNNPVRVFWGQIFRFIGGDWSFMNAVSSAIATRGPLQIGPMPICLPSCALRTPLDSQWGFDNSPFGSNDPKECTDTGIADPPGQEFFLSSSDPERPGLGWTNFEIHDCSMSCGGGSEPTPADILPYLLGAQPPDICHHNICTTNGTLGVILGNNGNSAGAPTLRGQFLLHQNDAHVIGTQTIHGWRMRVPIVSDGSCGTPVGGPCPGSPAASANPYTVEKFAEIIITDVITTGGGSIRLVGVNNPTSHTFSCQSKVGPSTVTTTYTRTVTTIGDASGECPDCAAPPPVGGETKPRLVK